MENPLGPNKYTLVRIIGSNSKGLIGANTCNPPTIMKTPGLKLLERILRKEFKNKYEW